MKRRRSIPRALFRLRVSRAFEPAGAPSHSSNSAGASQPRSLARAARRLRDTFLGVMPNAGEVDAANDSEK
jgi:hypothetical protein